MGQENLLGESQQSTVQQEEMSTQEHMNESVTPLLDSILPEDSTSETLRANRAFLLRLSDSTVAARIMADILGDVSAEAMSEIYVRYRANITSSLIDVRKFQCFPGEYIDDGGDMQVDALADELLRARSEYAMPLVAESLKRHIAAKQATLAHLEGAYQEVIAKVTPDMLAGTVLEASASNLPEPPTSATARYDDEHATEVLSVAAEAASALAEKDSRISTGRLRKILGASVFHFFTDKHTSSQVEPRGGIAVEPIDVMKFNRW